MDALPVANLRGADRRDVQRDAPLLLASIRHRSLGFGRIVASGTELPNTSKHFRKYMLVSLG